MKPTLNPSDLNGYILQAVKPLAIAIAAQFFFDFTTDQMFLVILVLYVLFAVHVYARLYIMEGRAYYIPLMKEAEQASRTELSERDRIIHGLQDELAIERHRYEVLHKNAQDLVTYTNNLKHQNNEGMASMHANYAVMEKEVERLRSLVLNLESGVALSDMKNEMDRRDVSATETIRTLTRDRDHLKDKLANMEEQLSEKKYAHQQQLTDMRKELDIAKNALSRAEEEISNLLPIAQKERVRTLKQSFKTLLNNSSDEAAIERTYAELLALGETNETLKLTEEQISRLEQSAQQAL